MCPSELNLHDRLYTRKHPGNKEQEINYPICTIRLLCKHHIHRLIRTNLKAIYWKKSKAQNKGLLTGAHVVIGCHLAGSQSIKQHVPYYRVCNLMLIMLKLATKKSLGFTCLPTDGHAITTNWSIKQDAIMNEEGPTNYMKSIMSREMYSAR